MIKFKQAFESSKKYGGVAISAWLGGREYLMIVPTKYNGHAHNWTFAVDECGDVYAYETTPRKGEWSWHNGNLDFIWVGTFDDGNANFEYDQWRETLQCFADQIYF